MKLLPGRKQTAVPTDLEILQTIYDAYHDAFVEFEEGSVERASKVYVPIDVPALARQLNTDPDIVFGRLYYDLEKRHGYEHSDGTRVPFFTLHIRDERHCINFAYMASVLARLRDEEKKYRIATRMAFWSLVIAVFSYYSFR